MERGRAIASSLAASVCSLMMGCFDPEAEEGLRCAADGSCPDGQECRAGTDTCFLRDNPVCVPGATPHDEDGDGVDDSCDNCPDARNPGQADSEAAPDGVGDACDPRPEEAGDRLVFFDSFLEGLDAEWALDGAWEQRDDALHLASAGPVSTLSRLGPGTLRSVSVRVSSLVDPGLVGAYIGEAQPAMLRCEFSTAGEGRLRLHSGATLVEEASGLGTDSRIRRLVLSEDATGAACVLDAGAEADLSGGQSLGPDLRVGLRGQGEDLTVESFAVYSVGGASTR